MQKAPRDVGPDPVWGLGMFILGAILMAFAGATTRHWLFNVAEGILLAGVVLFVGCVAITSHKQEHLLTRIKRAFRGEDAG